MLRNKDRRLQTGNQKRNGKQGREDHFDSGDEERNSDPQERSVSRYTTVAVDIYGRVYDISKEHPSWEQKKKGSDRCIVCNAFTCTQEEADRLTGRKK